MESSINNLMLINFREEKLSVKKYKRKLPTFVFSVFKIDNSGYYYWSYRWNN